MRFEKMRGRLGVIYNGLWGENGLLDGIKFEPLSKSEDTTYKIAGKAGKESQAIKEAYFIENEVLFDKKYEQAVSGDGNESSKILTLHSSSRCSLLSFYGLDEEHVLSLNLEGREVEFDFSTFEFKNPVIGYPSNMDVVLLSKNRDVVLFLESKFSEYYIGASEKSSHIGKRYEYNEFSSCFYTDDTLNGFGINKTTHTQSVKKNDGKVVEREGFLLTAADNEDIYLDGFKQMISHYIGIRRRLRDKEKDRIKADNENPDADVVLNVLRNKNNRVYLGEILFDNFKMPSGYEKELSPEHAFKRYSSLYSKLAEKMNQKIMEEGLQDRFCVLSCNLKYSDVIKSAEHIEDKTKLFYGIRG